MESSLSVFWDGEGGGVLAPPEEELVDASPVGEDLRRSATDSSIPVRAARVWIEKKVMNICSIVEG